MVSHGRRLSDSNQILWVLAQPRILNKLQFTLEDPMPDGMYEMYHHDRAEWSSLPEPRRPILIAPERALLWRRAGVTDMPRLEAAIRMTANHANTLPNFSDAPSTPLRGAFSLKHLATPPAIKDALDLIASPSTAVRRGVKHRGVRPGRMASTGGKKPTRQAKPGPTTTTASRLLLSSSSPPPQSSSPPVPEQLLRDVFGEDWKSVLPKLAARTPLATGSKRPRSPSPGPLDTPSKRPKHRQPTKASRLPIDPNDIIDISEDVDDEVVEKSRARKGKGKAKARVPIPPGAEIIELSD